MLTFEEISARYSYNPETGVLWSKRYKKPVGWAKDEGNTSYLYIEFGDRQFSVHRIAWILHTGNWPNGDIDHRNGDGCDNRISNLRDVDTSTNCRNRRMNKNNSSGFTGVHWNPERMRWNAEIRLNGKLVRLGRFKRLKHAVAARAVATEANGYNR